VPGCKGGGATYWTGRLTTDVPGQGRIQAAGSKHEEDGDAPEVPSVHRTYYDLPDRSPEAEEEDFYPLGLNPEESVSPVSPLSSASPPAGRSQIRALGVSALIMPAGGEGSKPSRLCGIPGSAALD
jgi:hypothetical protein